MASDDLQVPRDPAKTPEEEFVLFIERLHQKNRDIDPREIARAVNAAVREVRAKRRLSQDSAK
jgi:hypothetical protein